MYPIIESNEHITLTETMVEMNDGVRLYTRYVVPNGVNTCPTVFVRTPYEPAHGGEPHGLERYANNRFIQHGYAVVVQHCRGRGDSEGVCQPYVEREDGLATLEFIRKLPFYNGEIYVTGGSYLATVHLCYFSARPHDIKGAALHIQTDRMYFRNFKNGCNYALSNISWWSLMLDRIYPEPNKSEKGKRPYIDTAKRMFGEDVPEYTKHLIHNEYDAYWKDDPRVDVVDSMDFPVLLTEGWYDFYIGGMLDMWSRFKESTKKCSAMFVGPYGHKTKVSSTSGYPLDNGDLPDDYIVEWFDSIREKRPYRYATLGKVNYYSIGADEWRATEYPRCSSGFLRLYLESGARLSNNKPEREDSQTYVYDPEYKSNPYGLHNMYKAFAPDSEEGVLSFISEPVQSDQSFFGNVKLHLNVSTDCDDTAFFMRMYFVDGEDAYNLTETVGSISYFYDDYKAGEKIALDLECTPIAFTLKKGMRIRIDVSSKSGVYSPHANVKGHFAYVDSTRVAKNTVYIGESYVELPFEN